MELQLFDLSQDIDWRELQEQKHWLIARAAEGSEEADGLINFLDAIQDAAVDEYGLPREVVFCQKHGSDNSEDLECPGSECAFCSGEAYPDALA